MLPRPSVCRCAGQPPRSTPPDSRLPILESGPSGHPCIRPPATMLRSSENRFDRSPKKPSRSPGQINEAGGILGRKIKIIQGRNGRQRLADVCGKKAQESFWSTTRGRGDHGLLDLGFAQRPCLPVSSIQYNGMLYYPTFYEGLRAVQERDLTTGQESHPARFLPGLNWIKQGAWCERRSSSSVRITSGRAPLETRFRRAIARVRTTSQRAAKGFVGERILFRSATPSSTPVIKQDSKLTKPDVIFTRRRRAGSNVGHSTSSSKGGGYRSVQAASAADDLR